MDNDYTFNELEEVNFPSNFDITHSITLGATYQKQKWKVSSGINWHTGQPTTEPVVGNEILASEINFGEANSNRLQDYLRVDVSTLYQLIDTQKIRLESGISIWNVLNKKNKIGNFYRVIGDNALSFEEPGLGITANATMRLYF